MKNLVYNESGNMDALTTVAIGAIFIIILLSITVFMGSRLDAAIDLEGQETIYVENETFNTGAYGTWVQLNEYPIVSDSETVRNISTGMIFIKAGNYTMDYPGGKIATT